MFDMLKWDEKGDEPWDFKRKGVNPMKESEVRKYTARINHDKNPWDTE